MPSSGGIVGNGGGPYATLDKAVNVHIADVHKIPVNDFAHRHVDTTTLAAPANAGDISITVVDATAFIVGVYTHMGPIDDTKEPIHPQVVPGGVGNVIELDRPLDFAYAAGTAVSVAIVNMVTGSVAATRAAPVVYRYRPHNGNVEHITRILPAMTHTSAAADNLFGAQAALPNGLVIRAHISGQIGTFTNWKDNTDIKLDMFDVDYSDKVGGSFFGTNGRGSFSRIGVVISLDPAQGDYLEFLVQDPQTNESLRIKVQGHVEGR